MADLFETAISRADFLLGLGILALTGRHRRRRLYGAGSYGGGGYGF